MRDSNRVETSHKQVRVIRIIHTFIGIFLCASAAALATYFFQGKSTNSVLPLIFLAVVTTVALRYGIAAGVLGSIASAAIFAFFLYRPTGSLAVVNMAARSSLSWLLLGGVVLSYLFAPQKSSRQ